MLGRAGVLLSCISIVIGCSLVTSLEGLKPNNSTDAGATDAKVDAIADVTGDAAGRGMTCALDTKAPLKLATGGPWFQLELVYVDATRVRLFASHAGSGSDIVDMAPLKFDNASVTVDGPMVSPIVNGRFVGALHFPGYSGVLIINDSTKSAAGMYAMVDSSTSLTGPIVLTGSFPLFNNAQRSLATIGIGNTFLTAVSQVENGTAKLYVSNESFANIVSADSLVGASFQMNEQALVQTTTHVALFFPSNPGTVDPSILLLNSDGTVATPRKSLTNNGLSELPLAMVNSPKGAIDLAFAEVDLNNLTSVALRVGQLSKDAVEQLDGVAISKLPKITFSSLADVPIEHGKQQWITRGLADSFVMIGGSRALDGVNVTWADANGVVRGANVPGTRMLPGKEVVNMVALPPYDPLPIFDFLPFVWTEGPTSGPQTLYASQIVCSSK